MENTVITNEKITEGLNPAQKQAVIQRGSPLLVLAGAGSGKTKVLTHRIAHLISKGVHSGSILSVTFTNKAAKEMKERVTKLVSEENIKYAWLGTFHSVCARILRQDIDKLELIAADGSTRRWTKNFTIFDETDSVNAVKDAIKTLDLDPKIYVPKSVRYRISEAKNEKKLARDFHSGALDYREEKIAQIYSKYEEIMCRNNAFDFDDLLLVSVMLLRNNQDLQRYYSDRFKHILVDEYQDTNHAQYELITLLATGPNLKEEFASGERTLTVVGDVDQSIYSWRGADYKIILGFQEDYPDADIIKLEHNYRSTETILKVANEIINNNTER
ncbi:MAG: UvrD-helicase domain-containing protein, partial [Candidatus Melainabacteria bacterium]|nr:UvrD-helicase domain-containing protein [Candidatus Melainabacteria bacterium]